MTAIAQTGTDPAGVTARRVRACQRGPGPARCHSSATSACSCCCRPESSSGTRSRTRPAPSPFPESRRSAARRCAATSSARSSWRASHGGRGRARRDPRLRGCAGPADGNMCRLYLSGSGVLAQFGGVTLAFAFLATIGPTTAATCSRRLVLLLPLGHLAHLHLLPDPAHGAGLPARHRRAQDSVARGRRESRAARLAVLAAHWRPAALRRFSVRRCCCSPTGCPLTRRSWPGKIISYMCRSRSQFR